LGGLGPRPFDLGRGHAEAHGPCHVNRPTSPARACLVLRTWRRPRVARADAEAEVPDGRFSDVSWPDGVRHGRDVARLQLSTRVKARGVLPIRARYTRKSRRSIVNTLVVRKVSAAATSDASARSIGWSRYRSINSNARTRDRSVRNQTVSPPAPTNARRAPAPRLPGPSRCMASVSTGTV